MKRIAFKPALAKAIREGIRPDGSVIGPPMPYALYRYISDSDLAAIVAYLRTVPPVDNSGMGTPTTGASPMTMAPLIRTYRAKVAVTPSVPNRPKWLCDRDAILSEIRMMAA